MIPGTGGDCTGPDEIGCSYTGGDEYLWGAFWLIRLEDGLEDWGTSAGALAMGNGGGTDADPFSTGQISPWLSRCEYTSAPGCDCEYSVPTDRREGPSFGLRPGELSRVALATESATVRSTSVVVALLSASGFRVVQSAGPTPFGPPTLFPLGGELMLGGREKFLTGRRSGSVDVSDVADELVELAELPSKLSFDVCECG